MPNWKTESARFNGLRVGGSYSKKGAAVAMAVSSPAGSRDWGGIVGFANGIALFITLEKDADRYAQEHRYADRFDGDLLYWDSRASHTKTSSQVRTLRDGRSTVVAFARVNEKGEASRTQPFLYLGSLEFVDWWGETPVHFTWRLSAFPTGLKGENDLDALAEWTPRSGHEPHGRGHRNHDLPGNSGEASSASRPMEGTKSRALVNRYERDPRARQECLKCHGTACFVCGFDFASVYGSLGAGFIVVHHRVPVAVRARGGEYELDPTRDLVPICGNCHAIVHRRRPDDGLTLTHPQLPPPATARLMELRRAAVADQWESVD